MSGKRFTGDPNIWVAVQHHTIFWTEHEASNTMAAVRKIKSNLFTSRSGQPAYDYMKRITLFCSIPAVLLWAASAQADILLIDPGTSLTGTPNGATYTVGYDFTVGSAPLLVTELGIWDQDQNGLSNQHMVGLWDASGQLLTSLTIPSGTSTTLDGQFRYISLDSSLLLAANSEVIIGASYESGDADRFLIARTFENADPTFDAAITSGGERFGADPSALTFPSYSGGSPNLGDFGPNMMFDVVPEPSAFSILAVCLVGWILISRKRNWMHLPPPGLEPWE